MSEKPRSAFVWRTFTSVLLAVSFLVSVVSGAVLFIAPPGRVANWSDWRIWGLTKHQWGAVHTCFVLVVLVAAIVHLYFNWRPMVSYFKNRMTRRVGFRFEWTVALTLGVLVFVAVIKEAPPFSWLLTFNEEVKNSWEQRMARAPIPHAELLTLGELIQEAGVSTVVATNRLAEAGISVASVDTVVADIAEANHISAQRVFEIITSSNTHGGGPGNGGRGGFGGGGGWRGGTGRSSATIAGGQSGPAPSDHVPGGGGGLGFKTLAQVCAERQIDVSTALARLGDKGIEATGKQTLREIARQSGEARPYEILELIRSE